MLDILFFLLLTIFFVLKLKNSFGERSDEDIKDRNKTIEEFFKKKYGENTKVEIVECKNVVDITDKIRENQENKESIKNNDIDLKLDFEITEETKEALKNINFDKTKFLKGAENAIDMVNEAFSNNDEDTLRNILCTRIFINFKNKILDLKKEEKKLKSLIISFVSKEIKDIKIITNEIVIETYFKMEQITFVEDKDGNVIAGDKKNINIIEEKWTFKRDVNSINNFWLVDNIENVENS